MIFPLFLYRLSAPFWPLQPTLTHRCLWADPSFTTSTCSLKLATLPMATACLLTAW